MSQAFHLFTRFGVELEYMIVERESLNVLPVADWIIHALAPGENEAERGLLTWSNELALHVIELKSNGPADKLAGWAEIFQGGVREINRMLEAQGARLLPTGMHPWMDPMRETHLWPHGNREIYEAFHRIFDCRGHGWANLQSSHLNLPFASDDEFRRLHTAIRLILPLLPALAASSPFMEGKAAPWLDTRVEVYRHNCARIPSVTGRVVPELAESQAQYERDILGRIYRDLAPHDPDGILQEEWSNARGAIARFERNTIEIRLLDTQECPRADLAIHQFICAILENLADETLSDYAKQADFTETELEQILLQTVAHAGEAVVENRRFLSALGFPHRRKMTAKEILGGLLDSVAPDNGEWPKTVALILRHGCLARRIKLAAGENPGPKRLVGVYRRLADCLQNGELFLP